MQFCFFFGGTEKLRFIGFGFNPGIPIGHGVLYVVFLIDIFDVFED